MPGINSRGCRTWVGLWCKVGWFQGIGSRLSSWKPWKLLVGHKYGRNTKLSLGAAKETQVGRLHELARSVSWGNVVAVDGGCWILVQGSGSESKFKWTDVAATRRKQERRNGQEWLPWYLYETKAGLCQSGKMVSFSVPLLFFSPLAQWTLEEFAANSGM